MSLHINLLLPSEQRSASVVNLKFVSRLLIIVIPVILLAVLSSNILSYTLMRAELRGLQQEWEGVKPTVDNAEQISKDYRANKRTRTEFDALKSSRLNWAPELDRLANLVPPNMTLDRLVTDQDLVVTSKGKRQRIFTLLVEGRAIGHNAERAVNDFKVQLEKRYTEVEKVNIQNFGADPSQGAKPGDRVFSILCTYEARTIE